MDLLKLLCANLVTILKPEDLTKLIISHKDIELLNTIYELDQSKVNKETLLHEASISGRLDIIIYLKDKGVDIHRLQDDAFRWACGKGHLDIVEYLFKDTINIEELNGDALRASVAFKNPKITKFLLDNGANINVLESLHYKSAIEGGFLEILCQKEISDKIKPTDEVNINLQNYVKMTKSLKSYYGIKSSIKQEISFPDIVEIQKDNEYYYVYVMQGEIKDLKGKEELMSQLITSFNTGENKVTGPEFYML